MLAADDLAAVGLLEDAPSGQYLLEFTDGWLLLWRLSEGEPADEALEPATGWPWLTAELA